MVVIIQFKAIFTHISHCNHRLMCRISVLVKQDFLSGWKTMQLVSGKVKFNVCQVSLVWQKSFFVNLWTFQPTLVQPDPWIDNENDLYALNIIRHYSSFILLSCLSLRASFLQPSTCPTLQRSLTSTTSPWPPNHGPPPRGEGRGGGSLYPTHLALEAPMQAYASAAYDIEPIMKGTKYNELWNFMRTEIQLWLVTCYEDK